MPRLAVQLTVTLLALAALALAGDGFDVLAFVVASVGLIALARRSARGWRWVGLHGCIALAQVAACNHVAGYPDGELAFYLLDLCVMWGLLGAVVLLLLDRIGRGVWALALAVCATPLAELPPAALRTAAFVALAEIPDDLHVLWATRVDRDGAIALLASDGSLPEPRTCHGIETIAPCPCTPEVGVLRWEAARLVYDRSACLLDATGGTMDSQWLRPRMAAHLVGPF